MKKELKVSDVMTKDPIAVNTVTSLDKVLDLMLENNIRRLPVLDEAMCPIGIISDRDLRLAVDSPFLKITPVDKMENLSKHKANDIMRTNLHTIEESVSVLEAAKLMHSTGIGSLPVLNIRGKLSGIVTRSDLVEQLVSILDPNAIVEKNDASRISW